MAEIVRLKHITRKNDWNFYFYNGTVKVHKGVIELPADNFTRVRRAWLMGFRLTEDGQPISANRFGDIVAKATVADSSEEQKSEQKSSSRGRQSRTSNRVRKGESRSGGNPDESGPQSGVHSGSGELDNESTSDRGSDEVPSER